MNGLHQTLALGLALLAGCASVGPVLPVAQHETSGEGGHDWRAKPHHLSLLLGSTIEEDESAPTFGIDYEVRTSEFLGLGVVLEHALEDIDATTLLFVADLHITNQFILQTGPGIEFLDDEDRFAYRIGMLYEWEREGYTLSPQIHYDFTSGEDAVVLALAVGYGF